MKTSERVEAIRLRSEEGRSMKDIARHEIESFWLGRLGLSRASLLPSRIHVHSKYSKKKRANFLPYGTCHVCVTRTEIVQHIFGAIQEYGGFERPEWLDGLRSEVPPVRS